MNQIDNHFSKKLRDLEIEPSDRANELFNSKIAAPPKSKRVAWTYFALAASVMLVLGVLFALNLKSDVPSTDTALVLPQKQTKTAIEETPATSESNESAESTVTEGLVRQSESKPTLTKATINKANVTPIIHKHKTSDYEVAAPETDRLNLGNIKSINTEKVYSYHSNDLVDYTLIDVITSKLDVVAENSFIEPDQEIKLKEKPLIVKVINEVKYLLHGDKLDLERAGIKPAATSLAYNQSGLIASETQQFRENVHRIKEIFR